MANSLLDFVISLVRDPDAAARYAADPAQAIANAQLTGVTSHDVNNLIPMVSDSLSMASPSAAGSGAQVADHGNVWASGAATAAFDAFTPHTPAGLVHEHAPVSGVISEPTPHLPGEPSASPQPAAFGQPEPSVLFSGGEAAHIALDHGGFPVSDPGIWDHAIIHPDAQPHGGQPDHHDFGLHG